MDGVHEAAPLQCRMKNKGGLRVSHILFIVVNVDTVGLKADG